MTTKNLRLEITSGDASFSAEGDSAVVIEAYKTFREDVLLGTTPASSPKGPVKGQSANGKADKPKQNGHGTDNVPLAVFQTAHPSKTQAEAVAVLTTWANLNDGTEEFTRETVEELWRKSGRKKAGNIHQAILDAEKKGWLDKKGRGNFVISKYGIEHVLNNLVPAEQKG